MAERSKFAKPTWQLNGEGCSKLGEALRLAGIDCSQPEPKHGDIAKVSHLLGVSRDTARLIWKGNHSSNLKMWKDIFVKICGEEVDDLDDTEFKVQYCEPAVPKSLY